WNPEATDTWDLEDLHRTPEPGAAHPREQATDEVPALTPESWTAGEPAAAEPVEEEETRAAMWTDEPEPAPGPPDRSAEEEEGERPRRFTELDEVNFRLHGDLDMSEVVPPVQG